MQRRAIRFQGFFPGGHGEHGEEVLVCFQDPADESVFEVVMVPDPTTGQVNSGDKPQNISSSTSRSTGGSGTGGGTGTFVVNEIPGELVSYNVKVGDVLVAGAALCVLESMKMEVVVTVGETFEGKRVKALCARARGGGGTPGGQAEGDKLKPGDALVEVE